MLTKICLLLNLLLIYDCNCLLESKQYQQWGHHLDYDNSNSDNDSLNSVTPDPNHTHLIEDPGDLRCKEAVHEDLQEFVSVNTTYGKVVGRVVYLCDGPGVTAKDRPIDGHSNITKFWKNVTTFLGIPYAKPPTRENNLRFAPPTNPSSWESLLADRYRSSCPQYIRYLGKEYGLPKVDEDCLYFNIFTPWAASNVGEPYAVMIYIHGGYFVRGSGSTFPGHMLAASQDVVVVRFNFRLGILGYLSTGDNSSAGNFGLLDQIQAINWVHDNILAFNGDPNRITLFGPDAGAVSAGLLAISPLTKKTIKRVIAQSGAVVEDWALIRDAKFIRNNSIVAGYSYGCYTSHTYDLVQCLQNRSAIDFMPCEVKV